jgi:bud site selection protein 31
MTSKFLRRGIEPSDFHIISPTLDALEKELSTKIGEKSYGRSRQESSWPIVQMNWQRTRYVHDLYYKYGRISDECFEYCCKNKLIDVALSNKWLEPGYERLCSLQVIDPKNHAFGTTSLCRLPKKSRPPGVTICDPFSGCHGCASGDGEEPNIFHNKYGQRLAAIQIERERLQEEEDLLEEKRKKEDKSDRKKRRKKDKDDGRESKVASSSSSATTTTKSTKLSSKLDSTETSNNIIWATNSKEEEIALKEDDDHHPFENEIIQESSKPNSSSSKERQ